MHLSFSLTLLLKSRQFSKRSEIVCEAKSRKCGFLSYSNSRSHQFRQRGCRIAFVSVNVTTDCTTSLQGDATAELNASLALACRSSSCAFLTEIQNAFCGRTSHIALNLPISRKLQQYTSRSAMLSRATRLMKPRAEESRG